MSRIWSKKKVLRLAGLMLIVFVVIAIVCASCSGGKDDAAKTIDLHRYKALDTVSAMVCLLEKPDAMKVLIADDCANALTNIFAKFALGVSLAKDKKGEKDAKYDIIVAGAKDAAAVAGWKDRLSSSGVFAALIDVKEMKTSAFKEIAGSFESSNAHLWMISDRYWMVTARGRQQRVKLSAMCDLFLNERVFEELEKAQCDTAAKVFASYVAQLDEVESAFAADIMDKDVRPEYFVAKKLPPIGWIARGELAEDIFGALGAEIRNNRHARQIIIEGNMLSKEGRLEEASEKWALGMKLNPDDTMMLERLYRLTVNAKAFLEVGNIKGAAKCYETMILVRPGDAAAMMQYARTMRMLGKLEIATTAEDRARQLIIGKSRRTAVGAEEKKIK